MTEGECRCDNPAAPDCGQGCEIYWQRDDLLGAIKDIRAVLRGNQSDGDTLEAIDIVVSDVETKDEPTALEWVASKAIRECNELRDKCDDLKADAKYWQLRSDVMEDIIVRASRLAETDRATMTIQVLREFELLFKSEAVASREGKHDENDQGRVRGAPRP